MKIENGNMKMQNLKIQNMKIQNMKMQNMKIQNVKMFFVVSRLDHRTTDLLQIVRFWLRNGRNYIFVTFSYQYYIKNPITCFS